MQLMAGLADGSTTFVDSSLYARTVTGSGVMENSTDLTVFGQSMYNANGSGALSTAYPEDMRSGSSDFTIDGWFANRVGGFPKLIEVTEDNTPKYTFFLFENDSSGRLSWWVRFDGASWGLKLNETGNSMTAGVVRFVSCTKSGNNYFLHIEGTLVASGTLTGSINSTSTWSGAVWILLSSTAGQNAYGGPLRYTVGVARYSSANYTPPAAVFALP